MKNIIITLLVILPLIVCGQGNQLGFYKETEVIPTDYNPDNFKNNKKETVHQLREYLEHKDKMLDDVDERLNLVNNVLGRNYIDTCIGNKYLNKISKAGDKALIDAETKQYLKKLGYGSELEGQKTNEDLELTTDMISDKIAEHINAVLLLKKLKESSSNIKKDIASAHKRIDELYGFLYDDGSFKIWITIIFSCIIGSLLILFFVFISQKSDTPLAKDFLSSGNGLQFIALFSLIIAIILFGVLGILEGRELAAILSGISGYILGKGINNPKAAPAQSKQNNATDNNAGDRK